MIKIFLLAMVVLGSYYFSVAYLQMHGASCWVLPILGAWLVLAHKGK